MSTLLKKKYCKEHDLVLAETDSVSDSVDDPIQNMKPCSISTVTDEDGSIDEISDPVSGLPTSGRCKSVRFDLDHIVTINESTFGEDTETLRQVRDDIWYTVRSTSRRGNQSDAVSHALCFIDTRYSSEKTIVTFGTIAWIRLDFGK